MHARNLLVLAALFSVAPLSAHQRPAAAAVAADEAVGCPYEAAAAAAEVGASPTTPVVLVESSPDGSMLAAGRGSPAIFP